MIVVGKHGPGVECPAGFLGAREQQIQDIERFSEYRSHCTFPDGVVEGSNNVESTAVWSRDDLVPVRLSGYGMDEYALEEAIAIEPPRSKAVILSVVNGFWRAATARAGRGGSRSARGWCPGAR